ncbi:RNAse R [Mariprofundus ferrinatatus]|uniref:Ribonuclease R n=1 Tax=Mariprofundus ferrinatatus TaxID=1921087 RepID=A0A2K8L5K2_9PROT|nr:ribonuclease R [Mariprofundus ferrinatatus]ATX81131.1 RNAse R [Mariprofundus ferrinatatus]
MSRKKSKPAGKFKWPEKPARRRDSEQRSEDRCSSDERRSGRKPPRQGASHRGHKVRGDRKPSRNEQQTYTGKVSAHPDGFGFVDVEGREKGLFLPHEQMRDLMHGDIVEVRPVQSRGRESAEVVRIVEHAPTILVGQFVIQGGVGIVQPRSRKMPQTILITRGDANGATEGNWVRIKITRGPGHLRGKVLEILGDNLSPSALIDLIVAEQQLSETFPPAVLAEANRFSDTVDENAIKGRKDLRQLPFVTIDGEDARDFDDAICVLPRGEGFEAWVAIADVAQYVQPQSALDIEALERSNSFYFPDRVIPMLPEKLSNGLCSLNPHVARLAMTVRMRFDANGKRHSIHVYESVIHSQARLTYTQAARWIEDRDITAIESEAARNMLDDATRLFHKLEKKREQRGALDLDMPELRATLENNTVTDICESPRNSAHRLIEEMMLAANTAVAEFMEARECALLYRVHAPPERQAIETLNEFLGPFGLFVNLPKAKAEDANVRPGSVQRVLEQSEGKPFAHVLHRLVLRSLQRAEYTPENQGHFGLAYKSYTHFTSPIRRYADLIIHRRLKALISGIDPNKVQHKSTLAAIGTQTSTQERKQQRAEWDTQAMLAALFHQKDVGKRMPARIAGLTSRRIFFELEPTMAEGSLAVDDLPGSFILDETGHRLVARSGGASYHLGDQLEVVIDSVDPVRGVINVSIA